MQLESATGDAKQDLFSGLARKLLPPAVQHKLLTAQSLTPIERNQLIEAGRLVSGIQNALARFPGEGTLLTEEKLDEYFKTHTVKATVETSPGEYSDLIPVVNLVYNDEQVNPRHKNSSRRKLSLKGAVVYMLKAPNPPDGIFKRVMAARNAFKAMIAERLKIDPDAESKAIASLAQMCKPSHKKRKHNLGKHNAPPGPVPFDESLRGGGLY